MKNSICILMAAMAIMPAAAQLKVIGNGSVQLGSFADGSLPTLKPSSRGISIGPGIGTTTLLSDTTATLGINGTGHNLSGGKISFGLGKVNIEEYGISSGSTFSTMLRLNSQGGFLSYCGDRQIFIYNGKSSTNSFTYRVNVSAPQYLTSSDVRYKEGIEQLEDVGDRFMELNPVTYRMKAPASALSGETQAQDAGLSADETSNLRYGFIAQEVRELFPDLVYENEEGYLSIDYQGFIPILVDAVKELQGEVERQRDLITSLSQNPRKAPTASVDGLESGTVASLSQNRPNPFRTSTTIVCTVPESASSAYICIYDLSGSQKLRRDIEERGETGVNIEGNTLSPGMYVYSLIVDGAEIDSKRMILTD